MWFGTCCPGSILTLSIDCIAVNQSRSTIWFYKDYFFTRVGKKFALNEFASVCIYYQVSVNGDDDYSTTGTFSKTYSVALIPKTGSPLVAKELGNLAQTKKLHQLIALNTGLYAQHEPIRERG